MGLDNSGPRQPAPRGTQRDIWERLPVEERLRRVLEASPVALVLSDRDGHIEMVNREAERMFGYDRRELRDRRLEALMPCSVGVGRDHVGVRKDGTEFPVEIGLNPVYPEETSMVVASIVDITAQRRREAEQEHQLLELKRSNADLEEFAYVASHDLKAPLRAISHLVQWIAEDIEPKAGTETLDNLRLLRGRVMRLQTLLDGLLAYARIGRTDSSVETVDLGQVVDEVVSGLSPPPGFVVTFEGPETSLQTDRASILVVLQNLIGNAIRHHDRADGRVTVSLLHVDGVAEFRVSDDGPGIAPRFHDRIFMIFQTLASRDDVESSGIGLAIVKKRIEGHGGRIWVESAPPARGTTFVFNWKESAT